MALNIEDLEKNGINYTEALQRFGDNEGLYRRLAVKFLDDQHFAELEKAVCSGDTEKAQRAAHSLKGVAGNLSFDRLYQLSCKVNDALLHNDIEAAKTLMPKISKAYDCVRDALRKLDT